MNASEWLSGLVAHAYHAAPAVRAILDNAGLAPGAITTTDDLEHLPITRKDALIELQELSPPFGGFLGVREDQLAHVFMSPGPLFDPQGPEPDYWRFGEALQAAGFEARDVVLNASSYHLTPMGMMLDDAARSLGCVVIPSGTGNAELQITAAKALRTNAYTGTPSFLHALLQKAALPIRKAFVAGEMLPESLRMAIEAHGVRVFQGYGTADLGLLGYECAMHNGLHIADGAFVEIVDPANGQRVAHGQSGEVVATVNSKTYPLLRFGTGDLSALDSSQCACGRTSPRLNGVHGRVGDAVKVRGMFVHPRQLDALLSDIGRYQAIVDRIDERDTLVLRIEASQVPHDLQARLRDILHVRPELELVARGTLADDPKRLVDQRTWSGPR